MIDDMEEHVGGVGAVREIADLVDHQQIGLRVQRERVDELAPSTGTREVVDELGGRGKERVEAVLDGPVRDRDREVRFPATGFSGKDQALPLGDEVRRERAADERQADRRLKGKIEVVDGLEKREARATREARQARLLTMRDLFRDQHGEEIPIGPRLLFRPRREVAIDPRRIGQVQAPEERVERDVGGRHSGSSVCAASVRVGAGSAFRKCATYSAPIVCCTSACSRARRSGVGP